MPFKHFPLEDAVLHGNKKYSGLFFGKLDKGLLEKN